MVVVGGGPAGSAAAIILAGAGLRTHLASAPSNSDFRVGEGLPPHARSLLAQLGVLEPFLAQGHRQSFGTLSAWGCPQLHANDFMRQLNGSGWQLDRPAFDALLRTAAREAGATVHEDTRATIDHAGTCATAGRHSVVLTTHGTSRSQRCSWIIDATGRAAVIARQFGAARHRTDSLVGFHQRLESPRQDDQHAATLVEAVEDGWWYTVLLPSGRRLVVFLTDAGVADRHQLLSSEGFRDHLDRTRHLSALCAAHGYRPVTDPRGVDASSSSITPCHGPGWIATGDAALSFDPLSSKGIANALHTGIAAAQSILAARQAPGALDAYASHLTGIFQAYEGHLRQYYHLEQRWPHSPFWQRRHAWE